MMFGTVMMSNSTPTTTATDVSKQQTAHNSAQINTVSHIISKTYNEYMSDGDVIDRNYYNATKSGAYVLDGNSIAFDQHPTITKPETLLKTSTHTDLNNHNNNLMTMSIQESNVAKYTNNNLNTESTANNLRKQHSHQQQHQARQISERSVNFNENDDENTYQRIKSEKRQRRKESRRADQAQPTNDNPPEAPPQSTLPTDPKIQVQILPQDENWGENTTAFTADFSDFNDDMTEDGRSSHFNFKPGRNEKPGFDEIQMEKDNAKVSGRIRFYCTTYFGFICAIVVSVCAFITPILFIVLPRVNIWPVNECSLECEGLMVGIAFKLFILLIGAWAIFARKPRVAQLPRAYELRTLLLILLCLLTFSYWLFYAVRIIDARMANYKEILEFSVSYVDVLLFLFIVSVIILELRQSRPEFVVKIVRSPDGEQSEYTVGKMSIQRAAIFLLEQYYKDFAVYNPWLENTHKKRGAQLLKLEQLANKKSNKNGRVSRAGSIANMKTDDDDAKSIKSRVDTASVVGGNFSANDRFYEEYEYERRLRKRRARLVTTTEEAFMHVRRIQDENCMPDENGLVPAVMDPFETAQAVFTSIARDLRRYLRVTRQQPYFTRESIVAHLANCISYDMSPKSFLQRYLKAEPLVFNERALMSASNEQNNKLATSGLGSHGVNYHLNLKTADQSWILICDTALYQNCEDNLMFVLKQNEVSLMCTFKRMPRFNLIEDILDPKRNKFVIKFNSETTV